MNINLTNCDSEPIHIPGKTQSYAQLIAIHPQSKQIIYCSENVKELFDLEAKCVESQCGISFP